MSWFWIRFFFTQTSIFGKMPVFCRLWPNLLTLQTVKGLSKFAFVKLRRDLNEYYLKFYKTIYISFFPNTHHFWENANFKNTLCKFCHIQRTLTSEIKLCTLKLFATLLTKYCNMRTNEGRLQIRKSKQESREVNELTVRLNQQLNVKEAEHSELLYVHVYFPLCS